MYEEIWRKSEKISFCRLTQLLGQTNVNDFFPRTDIFNEMNDVILNYESVLLDALLFFLIHIFFFFFFYQDRKQPFGYYFKTKSQSAVPLRCFTLLCLWRKKLYFTFVITKFTLLSFTDLCDLLLFSFACLYFPHYQWFVYYFILLGAHKQKIIKIFSLNFFCFCFCFQIYCSLNTLMSIHSHPFCSLSFGFVCVVYLVGFF